ncbi:hypothetical protein ABZX88_35855 [Kitasatospora aureofaciens]|uniref:hypothetical protein n=1 Tax=Kitasatospora aureofaciens TaxID=1894 RepID=UPI0033AE89C2
MDLTPTTATSPHAAGPRLLVRLTVPLRRAGWADGEIWGESDEADENPKTVPATIKLSRSNFHISVHWDPETALLTVDDPTDGWGWGGDASLPPLFPLDDGLVIDLSGHPTQAAKAETARRAFAEAGLKRNPTAPRPVARTRPIGGRVRRPDSRRSRRLAEVVAD